MGSLGKWAAIDIETTGLDAGSDAIIDVGFIQFEGLTVVRKYSQLVRYDKRLPKFIQKLTGITDKMLAKGRPWETVKEEILSLEDHVLVAHNASFEKQFLLRYFEEIDPEVKEQSLFADSLDYFGLLLPGRESLSLESLILDFGIAEGEKHRGLSDSLDMVKAMLVVTNCLHRDQRKMNFFRESFSRYFSEGEWFFQKFLTLSREEILELSEAIEFDVDKHAGHFLNNREKLKAPPVRKQENPPRDFNGETIKKIFRDEDGIREKLGTYEYRQGQENLALKVGQSFKNRIHSLVQAPTGTGKTIGYLVPAFLYAVQEKKTVLVATGTKALQSQALASDIPKAREILGMDESELKTCLLIGSNNHLCELLFAQELEEEGILLRTRPIQTRLAWAFLESLFFENSRRSYEEKFTRENITYRMKSGWPTLGLLEQLVAADFRSCAGHKCRHKNECSYFCGLACAKDSQIIIGNHALLLHWPQSVDRPGAIIIDEAHRLESEATDAFTLKLTSDDLETLMKQLRSLQGIGSLFYLLSFEEDRTDTVNRLRSEALTASDGLEHNLKPLKKIMEEWFKGRPRYSSIYENEAPLPVKEKPGSEEESAILRHLDQIQFVVRNLYLSLNPYAEEFSTKESRAESETLAITRFEAFFTLLVDATNVFDCLLSRKEGYSHSVKFHEEKGFTLSSAPVDVGRMVNEKILSVADAVVFTSATLGNLNGDMGVKGIEWATGYTCLEKTRRFKTGLFIPPIYDYTNNASVFLCDNTPRMDDPEFVGKVLKEIIPLIKNLGGRSLVLFGSEKRFAEAREIFLGAFNGEMPLFIQGMGANVVEEYKKSPKGVLLGKEAFGEGIDIPGDALQFVFIDKIPDMTQSLVYEARRTFYERAFGDAFTDYYLAYRTRKLQQKLGRLLRTRHDRGGAIIVDSRIKTWKGKSINDFMRLMAPYKIQRASLEEAVRGVREFITSSL